jgi:hypothetical protein
MDVGRRPSTHERHPMHRAALKTSLVVTAKLMVTALSVLAIAWAVGVLDFEGQVPESHADIAWLSAAPRSNTQQFQRSLQRLGHDAPQVFDLNGNTVYFSVAYSRHSPEQVLRQYQDEFYRQGVNPRPFYDVDGDEDQMMSAGLSGGIIPLEISRERVLMGGMITSGEARDKAGLERHFHGSKDPFKVFRGHRQIEISRRAEDSRTTIVSTWSDERFDYGRMVPGSTSGPGYDDRVPACMGCTRLTRFEDLARDKHHVTYVFQGTASPGELRHFYDRAMGSRGWEPTDSHRAMSTVQSQVDDPSTIGQLFQYSRQGEFLTIMALPDGSGQTTVVATVSD